MVLNVFRSGFGTSCAKFTHATLSPLAKPHAVATGPVAGSGPSIPASPADISPVLDAPAGSIGCTLGVPSSADGDAVVAGAGGAPGSRAAGVVLVGSPTRPPNICASGAVSGGELA